MTVSDSNGPEAPREASTASRNGRRALAIAIVAAAVALCAYGVAEWLAERPSTPQGTSQSTSADARPMRKKDKGARKAAGGSQTALPPRSSEPNVVIGRPTGTAVTLSVLTPKACSVHVVYGPHGSALSKTTRSQTLAGQNPEDFEITGLTPDTRYSYEVRTGGSASPLVAGEFQTQRAPGSTFIFEVQGDSHPERAHQFDSALYTRTLASAAADAPDFYITSGDDFSVDTLKELTQQTVAERYAIQRPFLSTIGRSSAVFLVNGNHEQASAANLDGTTENVAIWAQTSRDSMFPQPAPNGFYTGDTQQVAGIGLLRDYYAWTWGDALFVVIDPYWHSTSAVDNSLGGRNKSGDRWAITLGDAQYAWLAKTLGASDAKYKFVFTHHVLGTGRGGVSMASQYEWGGESQKGVDEFASKRPNWDMPIHDLMSTTGVTVFFQGHDHVFAREELDGVVYQTLPEPADPNYALYFADAYPGADTLPSSGRVRVTVSPDEATVEYVRSYLAKDTSGKQRDNATAFSYKVAPR